MSALGTLLRSLLGHREPARADGPAPPAVTDGPPASHAEVERETVRALREGLRDRRADRQLEAAHRDAEGLRARMAALRAHGELEARGGGR
jgi:hypothetical protein